ncbi:2-succinyl-6-hydroxy-2,4-cyclohexadiene-1-carboxylate synthase [Staphylococcus felis]|uniref:Putative 2-succinyl-6-hydroxy-2,4-cyclohexadiene-1-carboxylate synthase n=1 Tax=Staphylococcus felis TaxID=46127 RepID=A0A2K3Z9U3_9STAP|nr:2-succinyl-6-hydroxy-2,4-cyclohexadiene-1-carboxylate synthase [Staphylococcus felis]AVP36704.1 2-succinyl-6-hydroxy-2,4-cyclohexadiene-1-carboxylate synthase [Staphylococcus felis]MBH9582067.1 2-succinyl-6-hydroxy-2,4-cyclohexadiene-1-carboxylate synthase [Staphylococcus felis]MDM8327781.1 2-succinyl-6-hydroxy-2,4-cyclohexadiene-1-carboxylate synthase [Staphylococcus felis]MDQ7193484.1 2-succinyl-6-hydroxy-2,4-cyclohexadiene-1-carboxylate synthase [Staphylococcus felis]PNZ34653.1 2-succiny
MLQYNFHSSCQETDQLLVMLHGFISDQRTYDSHIEKLSQTAHIITIDLPGHGQDNSSMNATWDFKWIASQIHQILEQFSHYQIYLHGYSMGARIALYYALQYQKMLAGLILESGSPGIQDVEARTRRIQVDEARAKVLEIADLTVFVNDWEKLPLFKSQYRLSDSVRKSIRQLRLAQQPKRLAKALRDYGTGNMPNLWSKLNTLTLPVHIIVGALDQKFIDIAKTMLNYLPHAQLNEVDNVGHTVHVEDSDKFDTIVRDVLLDS